MAVYPVITLKLYSKDVCTAHTHCNRNMNLQGKVVLVTGASSGIGEGCAYGFAKEGSLLSLTGRNLENLEKVKKQCINDGLTKDQIHCIKADMRSDEDIKRVIQSTIEKFGRLDVLINNAGFWVPKSLQHITMDEFDDQMRVNTRAPLFLTKLSLPYLKETKGNVVNISSIAGFRPLPSRIAYNMSKAAMDMFTESLALEMGSSGVRVNSVNPGVIRTNIFSSYGMDQDSIEKHLEHHKTTHILGRVGDAKDISSAVMFLASDQASFMTGHLMTVDGGWTVGGRY